MRPLDEAKIVLPSLRPAPSLGVGVLALIAILALSACATKTKTVRLGAPADEAALQTAKERADAAEERADTAEAALENLRESLAAAQDALGSGATDTQRAAVDKAQTDLERVRETLTILPPSAARTAADGALGAVDEALTAVSDALGAANAAFGSGGVISFANMHTTLDRAQTAVDDAQAELKTALAAEGLTSEIRTLLSQAQATLTVAQLSLIPQLRSELAAARQPPPPPPEPPPPTAEETALREAQTALTGAQAATAAARTALAAAQAALEQVETDFQATAAAWTGDTTDERKTAARTAARTARRMAQTALAAAERAFVNARSAERRAVAPLATAAAAALAAATTDDQRTEADAGAAAATAAQTATLAWTATRVAADPGLAAAPLVLASAPAGAGRTPFTARVTLTPREPTDISGCTVNARCRNPDALDLEPDAVPYAAGKTVLSPTATGDGDELPLRAVSMRGDARHSYEGSADNGDGAVTPKVPVVQRATTIDGAVVTGAGITNYQRHYRNPVTSSIRFTPDGMVFKTGGEGAVFSLFKHDLDRSSSRGRDGINSPGNWGTTGTVDGNTVVSDDCSGAYPAFCYDFNRSDVEIAYGAPYADPDGEPNYYWASRYGLGGNQPQPDPDDSDGQRLAANGALGDLRVWLSNHGGLDAGAMADDAGDDAERYLSYAAYGLFAYTDYIDKYPRPGLLQGFHFGYDAFRDADGVRTADVGPTPIEAEFEGRTMGMILHPLAAHDVESESAPFVSHFTRLRGDVTLKACIGGAGGCTGEGFPVNVNNIAGDVRNVQVLGNGVWQQYSLLRNAEEGHPWVGRAVTLHRTSIGPDGGYAGSAESWQSGGWNKGEYEGRLYGPEDELETAGWWRLETDSQSQNRHLAAFGSFGACQSEHCREAAPSN